MSISINKWNYKQMYVQENISTHEMYTYTYVLQQIVRNCMIEIEPHSEEQ